MGVAFDVMRGWYAALVVCVGCDGVFNLDHVPPAADAPPGTELLGCNPTLTPGDYSTTSQVLMNHINPSLTMAQDLMYMHTGGDLHYSTFNGSWSTPAPATTLNDAAWFAAYPRLSYDGKSIFFLRHPRGTTDYDLPYQSHRTPDAWEPPVAVEYPPVFAGGDVAFGVPSADGTRAGVTHGTSGHYHLSEVVLVNGTWTIVDTTSALYPVGSDVSDTNSQLAPDACWVVFTRVDRKVSLVDHEVMFAVRGPDGKFGPAQKLFTNTSTVDEGHAWLAPDGSVLYYNLPNGIYRATRN